MADFDVMAAGLARILYVSMAAMRCLRLCLSSGLELKPGSTELFERAPAGLFPPVDSHKVTRSAFLEFLFDMKPAM